MRILRWTAIIALISVLFLLLLLLVLWWCLKCQPAFYRDQKIVNVERAKENSLAMTRKIVEARNDLSRPEAHDWVLEFSEAELNHWMEIERKKKYPGLLRRLPDPRGIIRENKVSIGSTVDIRRNGYEFDGILSVDFLPYMKDTNTFAFKIYSLRAGIVSLPQSMVIKQITELAEDYAYPLTWTQENGYNILETSFSSGNLLWEKREIQVKKIELGHGKITISGWIAAKSGLRSPDEKEEEDGEDDKDA